MLGEKLKYLNDNDWITIWPMISVVLFTLIFISIVFIVVRLKKKDVREWEIMPLDEEQTEHSN